MEGRTGSPDRPRGLPVTGTGLALPAAIWALYFAVVCSVQGAGCAVAVEPLGREGFEPLWLVLVVLTVAAAGAILLMGILGLPRLAAATPPADRDTAFERATFLAQGTALNAGLFLVATLWIGLPTLIFEPCVSHRLW